MTAGARSPVSLSIIIPVRNKARFIGQCLSSVFHSIGETTDVEILLVENCSTDGTRTLLSGYRDQGATIVDSMARTAGEARNIGAENASGRILCFLDADVEIGPDYLSEVRRLFTASWIGAAGRTVELSSGSWIERVWGQLHAQRRWRTNALLNGASLCVRREVFEHAGGFDTTLLTGEDHELCLRLIESGETVVESPHLDVTHLDNPTTVYAFLAKERWRGLGAFGTARWYRMDKPLALTFGYLASLLAAFAIVVGRGGSPAGLVSALATASLVPVLSVAYRWTQADTPVGPLSAVFLYHLYFLARAVALLDILFRRHRPGSELAT